MSLKFFQMGILPNGMDFFPGEPDTVGGLVTWFLLLCSNSCSFYSFVRRNAIKTISFFRFPISKLRAAKAPVSENIDSSETEDDDDEDDDDDDDDDNDDDDDEGDDEDTESDDDGEDKGDPEDEPGANGDGGSEEDDDDSDDEDDDDGDDEDDDGGEEDEEEDEEEEIPQPPAKKRKWKCELCIFFPYRFYLQVVCQLILEKYAVLFYS